MLYHSNRMLSPTIVGRILLLKHIYLMVYRFLGIMISYVLTSSCSLGTKTISTVKGLFFWYYLGNKVTGSFFLNLIIDDFRVDYSLLFLSLYLAYSEFPL